MKKHIILLTLILMSVIQSYAQTATDALRYSRVLYGGTARFTGMSGAFGAVGADFSTVATNPAGIGLYSKSEMTFTVAPNVGASSSSYNGSGFTDSRVNFGIGNFGFVFNINPNPQNNRTILKSFSVGFGFNRQNDFNNSTYIQGVNMKNSLMTSYTGILNEQRIDPRYVMDAYPFDIGLAYATNLVFHDSATNRYYCDAEYGGVLQSKQINTYGSLTELDFAFAVNLGNKVFIGLTLGIPFISYYENSLYQESRIQDTIPNFLSLKYWYNLQTRGTGYNVKFGIIYKPTDWVRVGAAVHTPTWYPGMQDEWFSSMESSFTNTSWNGVQYSPVGYYDYKLTTPFRALGSLAFIIGRHGVISTDYEYINYSQSRFNSSGDSYTDINNEIKSTYQSWGNLRIGTEWALSSFRLRGGFGYFSNPYKDNTNDGSRWQVSGGFGYRSKYFFTDVSYVYSRTKQNYYLYDPSMVNPSLNEYSTHTVFTTVGFRF